MGYEKVIESIGGEQPRGMYRCPTHEDRTASLSIKEGDDGRALLYCHAGCDTKDVVSALGLDWSDIMSAGPDVAIGDMYTYTDKHGAPTIRVIRKVPKGFWQQHWTGTEWVIGVPIEFPRYLYKLPLVLKEAKDGGTVYIVEGEKDAESLLALGHVATTNLGGAAKWQSSYSDSLRGAVVKIIGDRDEAGIKNVERITANLTQKGIPYTVYHPAEGKDITDHLLAGLTLEELVSSVPDVSIFQPFDWETYEHVDTEWLLKPWIPKGVRVMAFGAAGSLKSLWAMWLGARLSNEGHKVAYFSLEMPPSELATRVKASNVTAKNFHVFKDFNMSSTHHVMTAIAALKGYSLVVIDSWSAAHSGATNDEVARLDNEFFLPLIEQTGATFLVIDNTGHDAITDAGKIRADHARGASAKGDKMDVTLWFHRPYEDNNYLTRIECKKMRLDESMPPPVTVETGQGAIEFYLNSDGLRGEAMWPYQSWGSSLESEEAPLSADSGATEGTSIDPTAGPQPASPMTTKEKLAFARLKGTFGFTSAEVEDGHVL